MAEYVITCKFNFKDGKKGDESTHSGVVERVQNVLYNYLTWNHRDIIEIKTARIPSVID